MFEVTNTLKRLIIRSALKKTPTNKQISTPPPSYHKKLIRSSLDVHFQLSSYLLSPERHTRTHTHTAHIHTLTYTHALTHTHTQTHVCTHGHTHTYKTHAHHTHTDTRAHAHTHNLSLSLSLCAHSRDQIFINAFRKHNKMFILNTSLFYSTHFAIEYNETKSSSTHDFTKFSTT